MNFLLRILKKKQPYHFSSAQWITMSFILIMLIGAFLLSLPIASLNGQTSGLDALFVAVSATCVTGLTTVNTAENWSLFGRIVILILIEIGGMSFLLISLMIVFTSKKKMSFSTRMLIKDYMNLSEYTGVFKLAKYTMVISFSIQALGAMLLSVYFIPQHGLMKGLGYSLFHNNGFIFLYHNPCIINKFFYKTWFVIYSAIYN